MSKQTAVTWMIDKMINKQNGTFDGFPVLSLDEIFEQAKEMEKEEIKDAYAKCYTPFEFNHIGNLDQDFEQYYNETYKKEEK